MAFNPDFSFDFGAAPAPEPKRRVLTPWDFSGTRRSAAAA
jgi:hypothetical protein